MTPERYNEIKALLARPNMHTQEQWQGAASDLLEAMGDAPKGFERRAAEIREMATPTARGNGHGYGAWVEAIEELLAKVKPSTQASLLDEKAPEQKPADEAKGKK